MQSHMIPTLCIIENNPKNYSTVKGGDMYYQDFVLVYAQVGRCIPINTGQTKRS